MITQLTADGYKFLSKVLIGELTPNYGLYVGYGNKTQVGVEEPTPGYFEQLLNGAYTGYARIPVLSASVIDNGILFTGMLSSDDLKGGKITRNTVLTTATLVNLGQTQAQDVFIYTAILQQPVKVVEGTYITVHVRLSLGETNA